MPRTRAFKSGNSQAVRIPAEIAYGDMGVELQISRHGDIIVIAPVRGDFHEALAELRRLPKPLAAERREPIELPERAGL